MNDQENINSEDTNSNELKEPFANHYGKKEIYIFNSFEEQNDYHLQKMALQTPRESLEKLEELRKIFYKKYLLPDGTWPPIARIITIKKPFF